MKRKKFISFAVYLPCINSFNDALHNVSNVTNGTIMTIRHNWTGLLVEPNSVAFSKLRERHRKAWLLPHCFSTKTTPEVIEFNLAGTGGENNTVLSGLG